MYSILWENRVPSDIIFIYPSEIQVIKGGNPNLNPTLRLGQNRTIMSRCE